MQIPQLTKYILEELERGTPEIDIKQKLFKSKWLPDQIEENYAYALIEAQKLISNYPTKKKKKPWALIVQIIVLLMLCLVGILLYIFFFSSPQQSPEAVVRERIDAINNESEPQSSIKLLSPSPIIAVNNLNDKKREQDRVVIQAALSRFYSDQGLYPQSLAELRDKGFLIAVPNDVTTNNPYNYETLQDRKDFKLCIDYEEQGRTCFNRLSN